MKKFSAKPQPSFTLSDGDEVYSVQGIVSRLDDAVRLTLKHDYPDAAVVSGWLVRGRGVDAVVKSVDGRVLTLEQ